MISHVTESWDRLAAAVRARRKALRLTQAELAGQADVNVMTIRNLEGQRQFSKMPGTIGKVERALGWEPGSAEDVIEGGEPTLVSGSVNARAPGVTQGSDDTGEIRGLPAGIRAALSEGEHLAGDVIDLSEAGSGFRLIVVAQRGMYTTPEDIATLRKQMKEWMRIQAGIRDLVRPQENKDSNEQG